MNLLKKSLSLILLSIGTCCQTPSESPNFTISNERTSISRIAKFVKEIRKLKSIRSIENLKYKQLSNLNLKTRRCIDTFWKNKDCIAFKKPFTKNIFHLYKSPYKKEVDTPSLFAQNILSEYRKIESESLDLTERESTKLWGEQTDRSLNNFKIDKENSKMPLSVIKSLATIKKAAAITNHKQGILPEMKMKLICVACDDILEEKLNHQFPLVIWQTGSGTHTNMNLNEVIANQANNIIGAHDTKDELYIHPNDDVNKSQSSNDVFPSAMSIAAYTETTEHLLPNIYGLKKAFESKSEEFKDIVKIGRTHTMDATPLSLGMEFSAFASQLSYAISSIQYSLKHCSELALGGTAVGTGLNTLSTYDYKVANEVAKLTKLPFKTAPNKFEAIAANDALVELHASLKQTAISLMKIGNDIRFLSSGPRAGINELILPTNEAGSSIMPGKVNPTQCEALTMVCAQVIGNDMAISVAASNGHFQLNAFKPMIIFNVLNSLNLLSDACNSFRRNCIQDIQANETRIRKNLENSLMLVTALNPHIGYDKSKQIVDEAFLKNVSLKEAAIKLNLLTSDEYDTWVKIENMIKPLTKNK